jgi:hypothetical protein
VTYNPNGNAAIATANGGTLQTGREYSVIRTGDDTLQLGARFDATGADTGDLFHPAAGVDPTRDRIRFSVLHGFETGDAVKYTPSGALISAGLNDTNTFFVRRLDDFTIKLYATHDEALGNGAFTDRSFAPGNVDATNDTITVPGSSYAENTALTYSAPAPLDFRSTGVDVSVSGNTATPTDNNQIYIPSHHLQTGDKVIYRCSRAARRSVVSLRAPRISSSASMRTTFNSLRPAMRPIRTTAMASTLLRSHCRPTRMPA